MSPRVSWAVAGVLLLLLGAAFWQKNQVASHGVQMELTNGRIEFASPGGPKVFLQTGSKLGADGQRVNLAASDLMQRYTWPEFSYTQLQEGLFLLDLAGERVFVFSGFFDGKSLDPTLTVDFNSDWVVLEKSSLLPDPWPEPTHGWVVMNPGTVSKRLKSLSAASRKPIIKPLTGDSVWVEKLPSEAWRVRMPRF